MAASTLPLALADVEVRGHVEPVGTLATDLYVVTRPAPRGPRGLWRALESVGQAPALRRSSTMPTRVRHEAHLGFLASLA